MDYIEDVLSLFDLVGRVISCREYGDGHINHTKLVSCEGGRRYILQQINEKAFSDVEGLMSNISRVTEFIRSKDADPRASMRLVPAKDGRFWVRAEGTAWRIYDFIEDTICLQTPETPDDFYESAVAFGKFQTMLSDFPAETLVETIKNFHNTPDRYRIFSETVEKDPLGRVSELSEEIDFAFSMREKMSQLQKMRESGFLPLRVTHNDTKLNNVLLDKNTRKALCVIDLDTVMPGLAAYDFGDAIRFGAATAAEDETKLSEMTIDLGLYESFTEGFLSQCRSLTKDEILTFPLGTLTMTMENGIRFLTDYIDGDHYYSINREKHNLDRARAQFALASEMERKWDDMCLIAEKYI